MTIPGAVSNRYTTPPVTLADDGTRFRCYSTNSEGTAESEEAILTVVPLVRNDFMRGDANADGAVDIGDPIFILKKTSGLSRPEAVQRLANGAWVTREKVGQGQVILFASLPDFRASTLGAARCLPNAVIYGPGLGAKPAVRPSTGASDCCEPRSMYNGAEQSAAACDPRSRGCPVLERGLRVFWWRR